MIVSHTHKYIFIKSLKTAGTSVEAALSQLCSGTDIVTPLGDYRFNRDDGGQWIHNSLNSEGFHQHDDAVTITRHVQPAVWRDYFKFSIARNPWDRAVSFFYWARRRDLESPPDNALARLLKQWGGADARRKRLFVDFLKTGWSAKKGEDTFQNNDRFYVMEGALCVDFVIRYETLQKDFDYACQKIGVRTPELPRLKAGMRRDGNHYSQLYDQEARELVRSMHENDIRLFGYEFEGA